MKENQIDKQAVMDNIIDLLTEFDEMGFQPTTTVPNPEAYAIKWRDQLTKALIDYRKQSEGEWIKYPHNSGIYCSLCKHKRRYRDIHDAFCPNYGAKMKGGGD